MDPPNYQCKRKSVIAITSLSIIGCIVMAGLSGVFAHYLIEKLPNDTKADQKHTFETVFIVMVVIFCLIGIGFQSLGLFGALKENMCLTTTYYVLLFINAVFSVLQAIFSPLNWLTAAWAVGITVLVHFFRKDLALKLQGGGGQGARPYYA